MTDTRSPQWRLLTRGCGCVGAAIGLTMFGSCAGLFMLILLIL